MKAKLVKESLNEFMGKGGYFKNSTYGLRDNAKISDSEFTHAVQSIVDEYRDDAATAVKKFKAILNNNPHIHNTIEQEGEDYYEGGQIFINAFNDKL